MSDTLGGGGHKDLPAPELRTDVTGRQPQRRSGSDFIQELEVAGPFVRYVPLQEWAAKCFKAPELLEILAQITQDYCCDSPGQRSGVVIADHPLIGLAAVHALRCHIQVPLRNIDADQDHPTEAALEVCLNQDDALKKWRGSVGDRSSPDQALLMRAWHTELDHAMLIRELDETSALKPQVICLVQAKTALAEEWVLSDTRGKMAEIVSRLIDTLQPRMKWSIPVQFEHDTAALISSLTNDGINTPKRILGRLNSPEHSEFAALLSEYQTRSSHDPPRFLGHIQTDTETSPRQAASLFVASHFPSLPPGEFLQIADLLSDVTPTLHHGQNTDRPSPRVTDRVLRDCNITFVRRGRNRFAEIHFPDVPSKSAIETAAEVRQTFDNEGQLLKERYLRTLALNFTLGHASAVIAEQYRSLEIDVLRASTPGQAQERLRCIVFGYPVFIGAGKDYVSENRRSLSAGMRRSLERAPEFINKLFETGKLGSDEDEFTRTDAVAALCTAQPTDSDEAWLGAFDTLAAQLFWSLYAANPGEVTLEGYPAMFGNSEMGSESKSRRQAMLAMLQHLLSPKIAAENADKSANFLRQKATIAALMAEATKRYGKMVSTEDEAFAQDFLGEVASQYLFRVVRGQRWDEVPAWPAGDDPVPALLSQGFRDWLLPWLRFERVQMAMADADRAEVLQSEGYRTWLMVLLAFDGLTGCASLGFELERGVLSAFMLDRMGQVDSKGQPGDWERAEKHGEFHHRQFWEWLCQPEDQTAPWNDKRVWQGQEDDLREKFHGLLYPIWQAIPLLLFLAAAQGFDGREQIFTITDETRKYLTHTAVAGGKPPLVGLLESLKEAQALQQNFSRVIGRYRLPPRQRDQWREALHARQEALNNLRRTLEPLRRYLYNSGDETLP